MYRFSPLFFVLLVSSTVCFEASAEIYRWVDENGKIQFSDRPAKGKISKTVDVDTSKNSYGGGAVLNRQRDLLNRYEDQDKQSQKNRQQAQIDKDKKEKLSTVCLQAKDKLSNFERGLIYTLDDQGQRVYYSEEQRTQRIESFRKTIKKNCS